MRTFIVDSDSAFRKEVRNQIKGIGSVELLREADSHAAALEAVARGEVDLLIVELGRGYQALLEQLARWRTERPGLVIYACSNSRNPDMLLAAIRAGVSEWIEKPLDTNAFGEAIRRAAQLVSAGSPGAPTRSHTTCVFSIKGGQGVTTVAVNTAIALARLTTQPCVLADLSFGVGDAASFLDLHPQYTFANLLGADGHADPGRLQSCLMRHSSGIYYLGERESLEEPSPISPPQLREVVTHLQESFAHIVMDLSHVLDGHTYEAFHTADTVLLVATCELVSVRSTKYALRLLQSLGFSQNKVKVVLNRVSHRDGVTPAQFSETIQYPIDLKIPGDYRLVVESINAGEPLALSRPKSPVARGIGELSHRLHDGSNGSNGKAK
ncbi:MAG: response regulator [Candidatus Latescibacterota bacterium]